MERHRGTRHKVPWKMDCKKGGELKSGREKRRWIIVFAVHFQSSTKNYFWVKKKSLLSTYNNGYFSFAGSKGFWKSYAPVSKYGELERRCADCDLSQKAWNNFKIVAERKNKGEEYCREWVRDECCRERGGEGCCRECGQGTHLLQHFLLEGC